MKHLLFVLLLIVLTTLSYGQVSTYQFKKVTKKGHSYVYVISGSDTIKFTKAAVLHKGKDQHAIIDGNRYDITHEKDKPWKFMASDSLIGYSRNGSFFDVKTVTGPVYNFSDSLKGENYIWRYSADGKNVITGRFYKTGGNKFVEINVLNSDVENFEFIKMMTLLYGVSGHYGNVNSKTLLIVSAALLFAKVATL